MTKLSAKQKDLYSRIAKILWNNWDPIGVNNGDDEWDDEYDSYVPHSFKLANEGSDWKKISAHLSSCAEQSMGLSPNRDLDDKIAKSIVQAKQEILG